MKVKAIRQGFYNDRKIRPGQVFELKEREGKVQDGLRLVDKVFSVEEQFSDRWMVKVGEGGKAVKADKKGKGKSKGKGSEDLPPADEFDQPPAEDQE